MSPKKRIEDFAQSIYLVIKNRYFDGIEQEDGQTYIAQVIDWTNMYLDELENTVDADGGLVEWDFARENAYEFTTDVQQGDASVTIGSDVDRVLTGVERYVQILQDGTPVSNWAVVRARDISNRSDRITEDMCSVVGGNLVFSRQFTEAEAGGTLVGDVVLKLPRLSLTNISILDRVKPGLLLKLGVAKNSTLPDIVQGGLSPSYARKYDDLLLGAMTRSRASSSAPKASRQSFGSIRGVY